MNGPVLLLILIYAVATVWVRERWALSILEGAVFVAAAVAAIRSYLCKSRPSGGLLPLAFAGMAAWGMVQMAAGWTVVQADTTDAVLYWLAGACLVSLGTQVCVRRERTDWLLKGAAIAGSVFCLIGLLHLYTSEGRVFWTFLSEYDSPIPGPFISRNNYAAFVELLVPILLVLALKRGPAWRGYLLLAAALVAATVASGSRAGAVLVIAEAVVVFLVCRRHGRVLIAFAGLAAVLIGVVGYQYLWERFAHDSDPFLVRREFLESTLAMIRTQPLHGFGLGAWRSAYPQFAVIDVGKLANHAHNEWAQWAAEGGLPALGVMLAVFLWTLRAAIRSVWGIGLVSVMVHSLVDYPFMRLGLAAWIFVLLGVLQADVRRRSTASETRRFSVSIPAAVTIPVLLLGVLYAGRLGWADKLYRRGTIDSLQRAVQLGAGRAEYELSLAQADSTNSVLHLERALSFNPAATNASIQLAAEFEASGDMGRSEQVLLNAARHDRQFAPSWALANFYFRRGQPEKFWPHAKAAVDVYRGDLRPIFDLCFLLSEGDDSILQGVVAERPDADRQFLYYLLERQKLPAAHVVALRLASQVRPGDRDVLFAYVDAALAAHNAGAAQQIWSALCRGGVECEAPEEGIANGNFARRVLNRGFDWLEPSVRGVVATAVVDGGPALSLSFSGKQPEVCEVLAHFLRFSIDEQYLLRFQYRTAGLPPHTGLYWSLGSDSRYEFDSAESWSSGEWRFTAMRQTGRLFLGYRRYTGTTRLEGAILLRNIQLERDMVRSSRPAFSFP